MDLAAAAPSSSSRAQGFADIGHTATRALPDYEAMVKCIGSMDGITS
jgi:hypothetical protein